MWVNQVTSELVMKNFIPQTSLPLSRSIGSSSTSRVEGTAQQHVDDDDLLDSEPLILIPITSSSTDQLINILNNSNIDHNTTRNDCNTNNNNRKDLSTHNNNYKKIYCSSCCKKIENCELCRGADLVEGKSIDIPVAYQKLYEILEKLDIVTTSKSTTENNTESQMEETIQELKTRMKKEIDSVLDGVEKDRLKKLKIKEEQLINEYGRKVSETVTRFKELEQQQISYFQQEKSTRERVELSNKPIHLNVGGTLFLVSLGAFLNNPKEPTNLFEKMFKGRYPLYRTESPSSQSITEEPCYFIDCESTIFQLIMDWLNFGMVNNQIDYYTFTKLLHYCDRFALNNLKHKLSTNFAYIQYHANQGQIEALLRLGTMYRDGCDGGVEKNYQAAMTCFTMSANQGDDQAQFLLGHMYHCWENNQSLEYAYHWYEKAALRGNANAQNNLGVLFRDKLFPSQKEKAMEWFEKASSQGHTMAMCNLASMYMSEWNYDKAREYYTQAALLGNAIAQNCLGDLFELWKFFSLEKAAYWYEQSAQQGYALAQYNLGVLYEKGKGVEKSFEDAFRWYEKAAKQGNEHAQNNLASLFESGRGVDQSFANAFNWYKKAADQGNLNAQYNLAVMYEHGQGTQQSLEKAIELYEKCAEKGDIDAQCNLGLIYSKSNQTFLKAFNWFQKSAANGHATSQNCLGIMYQYGMGIDSSLEKAREWYEKSANQGNPSAIHNLGSIIHQSSCTQSPPFQLYTMAAEQGDSTAQNTLGLCYESIQSFEKAFELYEKSANQGNASALNNLGVLYLSGKGCDKISINQALDCFIRASKLQNLSAINNIGVMILKGMIPNESPLTSLKWFEKSAMFGNSTAQLNFSQLHNQTTSNGSDGTNIKRLLNKAINRIAVEESNQREIVIEINHILTISKANKDTYHSILYFYSKTIVDQALSQVSNLNKAFPFVRVTSELAKYSPEILDAVIEYVHTNCIFTIPYFPNDAMDVADFKKKLGFMEQDGEMENETQFMNRMNGLITIYAMILQYNPSGHKYGIGKGWEWIAAFLNAPSHRFTVEILSSFLRIAGYKLFQTYNIQFIKIMNYIETFVLVNSPTGSDKSSLSRLSDLISHFKKTQQISKPSFLE